MNKQGHIGKKSNAHTHGMRTLHIDDVAMKSGLLGINPSLKVLIGIYSLFICLFSEYGVTAVITALIMVVLSVGVGKVSLHNYWQMIWIPLSFILLSGIVLLVEYVKLPTGILNISILQGYLIITKESLKTSVLITIKALCCINCLYMISLSTPMFEIISVLKKCRVPAIMIELMYLMYRFIFILMETYYNMKTSTDTRLGNRNLRISYKSFFGICTNLLVISFHKASRSFDAMEARGYEGEIRFLENEKTITTKQRIIGIGYCFIMFFILMIERVYGWKIIF